MIKLIASDLDGTLLTPERTLPDGIFEAIEKLHEKGVLFTPASGRQLPNLEALFAPVLDKIAIIAENGGLVKYGGKIIYVNPTDDGDVMRALKVIRGADGLFPLLSCAECSYYENDDEEFIARVHGSYSSTKKVADLDEIARTECVLKISVWDKQPPCALHGGPLLAPRLTGLRTIVSGNDWLDVSTPEADKGKALAALMQAAGVAADECEAYGDHMNDVEMLSVCGRPFVTENAFEGIKKIVKNRIPSNAEHGVLQRLKVILGE